MQAISGAINHRKAQDRRGYGGILHDLFFNRDLVVVFVNPGKSAPHYLYRLGRVELPDSTDGGVFIDGKRLHGAGFGSVQDTPGAVNIHAAECDDAACQTTADADQLPSLFS